MNKLISVIIPVYNVEKYLARCLDSIVNQTLRDIEIILIDDCSTDGSLEILKEYASKDERINLIAFEQSQGAAVARNKGLEVAKGEYIGFVDPDDTIDLNFYEELYKTAKEKDADITKCSLIQYLPDGTTQKGDINKLIKEKNKFSFFYEFTSAIYRASLISENNITFPAEVRKAQDVVFLNKVVLKAKSVELVDGVYYHYFRREGSLDADKIPIDKIEAGLMAYECIVDSLNEALGKDIFEEDYLYLYISHLGQIFNYLIAKNDTLEAKRLCIEQFIKLYNKCKMKTEYKKMLKPVYGEILDFVEDNRVEDLISIFAKYKNVQHYCLSKIKSKVKQDLSKGKQIPIFLSSDSEYGLYLPVVIKSICDNTNSAINFCILDSGIEDKFKNIIIELCSKYKDKTVEFIDIKSVDIFSGGRIINKYVSKTAYNRIYIPEIKPELDKVLYLDVDLIVNIDIEELFNQNIGEYIIGAVYEEKSQNYHNLNSKKSLGIPLEHRYFNSGVLVINCKKWRENNITQKLKDTYLEVKDRMIFCDQDLFNIIFSVNNYYELDKKYNYQTIETSQGNDRGIIHYDGSIKPWQFLPELKTNVLIFKDIWWEYAQKIGYTDIIKEQCIYRDENSLRVVRAKKAHQMMTLHQIEEMLKQDCKNIISVIIPVYNAAKYLPKCLNSLLSQTFRDFEVICINDKSQDNSLEILKEFQKKDERIKIIDNEKNLGAAFARNEGIEKAKGKYIYFLDSDDYIDEKYLECMYEKIEKENCDVVLNLSICYESNGTSTDYKHPSMPEINRDGEYMDKISTIHDAPCFIWARIYRKSFLDEHKLRFLDIRVTEDVAFNAVVGIYLDKTFVFYGEKYHYTVTDTSLIGTSKAVDDRDFLHIKAHSFIYDYLKEHNKLDDRLKLFRVYPFIKVDSEEKFNFYKKFFEKIENDFHKNENIYNEMEKYFAYSLLNSSSYENYLKNYNKVVTIGFLRRKVRV